MPITNKLEQFHINMEGELEFLDVHMLYKSTTDELGYTLEDRNYADLLDLNTLTYLIIFFEAFFEAFMEDLCRDALAHKPGLQGHWNPTISWTDIQKAGGFEALPKLMVDRIMSDLQSGKLTTYHKMLKQMGVTLPQSNASGSPGYLLEEVFLRRNMFVHSNNEPDAPHIADVNLPKSYIPGGPLYVDRD